MHITLEDICGMASPGWGEGCEVLDEVLDFEDEPEQLDVKGLYTDGGERECLSTVEICDLLKNDRMLRKDLLEQELLAIRKIYPANGADLKILIWLAAGLSYQETAEHVGRTHRTIKNAVRRLRQFRDSGKVKLLPTGQVQTVETLTEPLPKSRAGRKPKKITTGEIIQFDLLGDPIQIRERKARRPRVRRPRVRPVCEGQLELFLEAA